MQSRKETGNVWQKRERSDATRATYSLISIRIVRDVRSGGSGSSLETVSKSTVLYCTTRTLKHAMAKLARHI